MEGGGRVVGRMLGEFMGAFGRRRGGEGRGGRGKFLFSKVSESLWGN